MKKTLAIICIFFFAMSAFGQTIIPSKIDLDKAEMHLAGVDQIYVTDIYYGGTRLSVLLKFDGTNGAIIYGPWYDGDKLLKDYYELGYATLETQGMDTILVSDLIFGTDGYSARLKFDGVSKLILNGAWTTGKPKTHEVEVAELKAQVAAAAKRGEEQVKLADQISELKIGILMEELAEAQAAAQTAIAAAKTAGADVSAMKVSTPGRLVQSGFTGGRSLAGNWTVEAGGATQSDPNQYFAKFMIPLTQSSELSTFSFDATVKGDGFAGYGLHFYASNEARGNGYGLGDSYLVWLTRDPDYYGTDTTYLQLYRSYDDVKMIQLVSVAIPTSMTDSNTVEVQYARRTGLITVSINGMTYPSFIVDRPIMSGNKIALRSLGGPVTFSDLTVKGN
jgi:hypothetical protein